MEPYIDFIGTLQIVVGLVKGTTVRNPDLFLVRSPRNDGVPKGGRQTSALLELG